LQLQDEEQQLMAAQQAHLHVITNNHEQILSVSEELRSQSITG
jgi:hypothetical protein